MRNRKTPGMRLWEYEHGLTMEELFSELEHSSLVQLADKYQTPYATLDQWKDRMGVKIVRRVTFAGVSE